MRRSSRPGCLKALVVVAFGLFGVPAYALEATNGPGDVDLWPFSARADPPPPAPATPAVMAPSALVPGVGGCIAELPLTFDEQVTVVDCAQVGSHWQVVGRVELAAGPYRGDGPTWGEAVDLCDRLLPATTGVVVPSRDDWSANGERTVVCLQEVGAG